jgi:hypothetical protein
MDDPMPFEGPLVAATYTGAKPKCRRHEWWMPPLIGPDAAKWNFGANGPVCRRCGALRDEAAARRGKNNRQRGNSIERELGKKLGMARTGQFGGKDDLSNALFKAQVKSGGYFSERQWAWLKSVPVQAGQTALLVIADTPGPGKKRRAMVILDLDDWRELHGEADSL